MKKILLSTLAALSVLACFAQENYGPTEENLAARERFENDRFGIFIHWGLYSMLGYGEWIMNNRNINFLEYSRLAGVFCPSAFDAEEWVKAFKNSGAKYVTITSRHHDGFSLFHSDASPYNIVDATPFGRDVLKELADACAKEGLRLHLYYSHLDWGRTDYFPRGRTGLGTGRPEEGDWNHYLDFINSQLTELLTNYGPIGAIWFDGIWDMDAYGPDKMPEIWNLYEQYELIHSLQPSCLIANNHHLTPFGGEDIQIFERDVPGENYAGFSGQAISRLPLETCQTMNHNWGYNITDKNYKSTAEIVRLLVRTAGKGANLLLNVGPRPDGSLPDEAVERLDSIGKWMDRYGETIYGTKAGDIPQQDWGSSTRKGENLYLHIIAPETSAVEINLGAEKIRAAESFPDGAKVHFARKKDGVYEVEIPLSDEVDRVVSLTLR